MDDIRAAICGDKEALEAASALEACFGGFGAHLKLDRHTSSGDPERRMGDGRYQIVFLDMDMPGTDGVELGLRLREAQPSAAIVFVVGREDRVFDALRARPFGFVRKSRLLRDAEDVARLYMDERGNGPEEGFVSFEVPGEGVRVFPVPEITYVECAGAYRLVHMRGGKEPVRVRARMREFEEGLSRYGFLCPHKSFLVNHRYVDGISGDELVLSGGERVAITKKRKTEVVREYMRLARGG